MASLHSGYARYSICKLNGNHFCRVVGAVVGRFKHQTRVLVENALGSTFGLSLHWRLALDTYNAPQSSDYSTFVTHRWSTERMKTDAVDSLLIENISMRVLAIHYLHYHHGLSGEYCMSYVISYVLCLMLLLYVCFITHEHTYKVFRGTLYEQQ